MAVPVRLARSFGGDGGGRLGLVGKLADLVVLDRDPFDGPACEIGEARVLRTFVEGAQVFASA